MKAEDSKVIILIKKEVFIHITLYIIIIKEHTHITNDSDNNSNRSAARCNCLSSIYITIISVLLSSIINLDSRNRFSGHLFGHFQHFFDLEKFVFCRGQVALEMFGRFSVRCLALVNQQLGQSTGSKYWVKVLTIIDY